MMADGDSEQSQNSSSSPREYQSSWTATDAEGKDYLYRLGKEASNMRIEVGAKAGMIDHVFVGDFLGKDGECGGQEGGTDRMDGSGREGRILKCNQW